MQTPNSITHKILGAIFLVSSVVTLITTLTQLGFDYSQEMSQLEKNILLVEKGYTKSLSASVWNMHEGQIQSQLDGITSIPGIQFVQIRDQNKIIAKSGTLANINTKNKKIDLIYFDSERKAINVGQLEVHASIDLVLEKIYKKIFLIFVTPDILFE